MTDEEINNNLEQESIDGATAPRQDDVQAKCDEYLAGWKRALADYENLQKQNSQAREDDRRRNRINLANDLLPVVDNFEQAMKFAPQEIPAELKSWFTGISHIARQFAEALKNMGIEPVESVGHVFNPNIHESGGSRFEEDKPENVVLEEVMKGWKLGDIVIRPAKVIVNQKAE